MPSAAAAAVLRRTASHLLDSAPAAAPAPTAAAAVAAEPPAPPRSERAAGAAAEERRRLLSDAEVADFVRTGIHVLPLQEELGAAYHADVNEKVVKLWSNGGMFRFGNNIYPGVPELAGVLQAPSVRGALTSVLGKDYVMHAHRALHLYEGMGNDQGFHQDTPEGHGPIRFHRNRWAMILYYPCGATEGMGPTGVLPGGHFFQADPKEQPTVGETLGASLQLHQRLLTVPANQGTAVLIHFHTWHRGTKRLLEIEEANPRRPMIKFQFFAASDPLEPSWAHDPASSAALDPFGNVDAPRYTKSIWEDSLAWMKGAPSPTSTGLDAGERAALIETISTAGVEHEQARIGAAYTLGQAAKGGDQLALEALQSALRTSAEVAVLTTDAEGGKFAGIIGDPGDQSLAIHRAGIWGLAAAGDAATSSLVAMLGSGDVGVVQRAAHALSESCEHPDCQVRSASKTFVIRS